MANAYFEFQVEGAAESRRFELTDETAEAVIGRSSECAWVVPSGAVSRRHARVLRRGNDVTIEDLGSSNGTFVNGERLTGPRALRDQDRIQLGSIEGRFVMPPPEPAADATIAFDAQRTMLAPPKPAAAPPPPPPVAAAPPTPAVEPGAKKGDTGTRTVTSPEPPAGPPAAAKPPKADTATTTPAAGPLAPAAPRPSQFTPAAGAGPSYVELAVIAIASFLAVLGIGALLIRFVF